MEKPLAQVSSASSQQKYGSYKVSIASEKTSGNATQCIMGFKQEALCKGGTKKQRQTLLYKQVHDKRDIAESLHAYINS